MIQSLKRSKPSQLLQGYWLISPLLVLLYLYLATLNLQISPLELLNQANFAFIFLNACIAFTQSYWLKSLAGVQQKRYLQLAFLQQLASLNLLGAILVFCSLRTDEEKTQPTGKLFFFLGCGILILSFFVSSLILLQQF